MEIAAEAGETAAEKQKPGTSPEEQSVMLPPSLRASGDSNLRWGAFRSFDPTRVSGFDLRSRP